MDLRELQLLQLSVMKDVHKVCIDNNIRYYLIAGSLLGAVRHGGFIPWDDDIDIAMMRNEYEKFKQLFYSNFDKRKYFLQSYETDIDFRPALMRLCIKGTIQDLPYESHLKNCKNTYIDIFPLDNVPDSSKMRKIHARINRVLDRLLIKKLYKTQNNGKREKLYHLIALITPLKLLQSLKVMCMQLFDNIQTECVCSMESHYSYERQTIPRVVYGTPKLVKFEDTEFCAPTKTEEYLSHLYGDNYMSIPPEDKREKPYDAYIKID